MIRWMFDDIYETMPWDKIDAVVFDVGNVLLSFNPQNILNDVVPEWKEQHPLLLRRVFQTPYWVMGDHGTITVEESIQAMTGRHKELEPAIRKIMANWIEMKDVLPDGMAALQASKAHGKKLYVLSNYGDASFDHVDNKYEFFKLFDGKMVSSRLKMMKPDPNIFRTLLLTYDLDPTRTLFLDDNPANVEAALAEGIQAILVNEPGKLARFFA